MTLLKVSLKPAKEETFHHGQRQGAATSWWESGKPASVEEYAADTITKCQALGPRR